MQRTGYGASALNTPNTHTQQASDEAFDGQPNHSSQLPFMRCMVCALYLLCVDLPPSPPQVPPFMRCTKRASCLYCVGFCLVFVTAL
jgi:hypothetical protein